MKLNRKSALIAACTAMLTLAAACSSGNDDSSDNGSSGLSGQQMVFVNFGSDTMDAAKAAWLEPFSEKNGVTFATDSPSDPAKVKAMVEAGNTTWDVIDLDAGTGAAGCGTLFEKRSADVDVSEVDPQMLSDDCGVPIMLQTLGLVYNKEKFGDNPPTTITDFTDTKKFPGKRITLNYAFAGLEGMLLGDGVAPESLYPLDYDRAAKVVDSLGNDLRLLPTTAAQSEALESGDFAMCWCYLGRSAISVDNGADIGVVWENAFSGWDMLYAIKGSKSPEAQQAFLNYVASPEAQTAFSEELPNGPTTPSSKPNVSDEHRQFLLQYNMDKVGTPIYQDMTFWTTKADEAFAAWTDMTAG